MHDSRRRAPLALVVATWAVLHVPVAALEVPATVPPYHLVRITHRPDAWLLIDPVADGVEPDVASSSASLTVFVAPPGRYRVRELYVLDGRHVIDQAYVEIAGNAPVPPVPPDPVPPKPPEPDPGPLPPTKYGVGPAVARGWSAGVTAEERAKMAVIFDSVAKALAERTIPTVQDAVTAITLGLREMNARDQLQSGYGNYVEIMQRAFDASRVRTTGDYVGAYREISQWLRK